MFLVNILSLCVCVCVCVCICENLLVVELIGINGYSSAVKDVCQGHSRSHHAKISHKL